VEPARDVGEHGGVGGRCSGGQGAGDVDEVEEEELEVEEEELEVDGEGLRIGSVKLEGSMGLLWRGSDGGGGVGVGGSGGDGDGSGVGDAKPALGRELVLGSGGGSGG
jgi:hypothetical protein